MLSVLLYAPFLIILLSLSLIPLLFHNFWHKHMASYLLAVTCISVLCDFAFLDTHTVLGLMHHALVQEYIPFICTITSLYVISCNMNIDIHMTDSTRNNAVFLFIGGCLASIFGTTGASMLLIKPFIKINKNRRNISYMIVFFIIIVSNIGGILTPLGDPPLFVGYLNGIHFFWTTRNLFLTWLLYIFLILSIFYICDKIYLSKHKYIYHKVATSIVISGKHNLLLLAIVVASVFVKNHASKSIIALLASLTSILLANRQKNRHSIDYGPIKEVTLAFLAIFITISPVMLALHDNKDYISAFMDKMSHYATLPNIYYWMCGLISSVLDNAPSYLLFFNIAGNAESLMESKRILIAISSGAVIMGSLTYIGNAPNMLVKSVAQSKGIKMYGFFSYSLIACAIVIPSALFVNYIINIIV